LPYKAGHFKAGIGIAQQPYACLGLKVHRNTVVAAYDELYAQSWVDVYPQKGIFVAANLPEVAPRPIADSPQVLAYPEKTHFEVCDKNYHI
jgi:GntR family transcriptional regulator/MocR family aminotransferase